MTPHPSTWQASKTPTPTLATEMATIYVSLAQPIFAGILNMAWVKTPWLRGLGPIDGTRTLADGRRIFGDNKTWKGLIGMTALGAASGVAWGALVRATHLERLDLLAAKAPLSPGRDAAHGAVLGLAYALAELPNSFLKRRIGITPGRRSTGPAQVVFVTLDQIDSVVGCALALALLADVSAPLFAEIVVAGGVTHVVLNLALYAAHLRANPL